MTQRTMEWLDAIFPVVRASELALTDGFLEHKPNNGRERWLLKMLLDNIPKGIEDFRAQIMDPSLEEGRIVYKEGSEPAVGETCEVWSKLVSEFLPEKKSRIGNEVQYAAFLGTVIKELIDKDGYSVDAAWATVCGWSIDLVKCLAGKYELKLTATNKIGKWFDLNNTCKVLRKAMSSVFLLAGSSYDKKQEAENPANIDLSVCDFSVVWVVMDV